jgi:hypothetical protein
MFVSKVRSLPKSGAPEKYLTRICYWQTLVWSITDEGKKFQKIGTSSSYFPASSSEYLPHVSDYSVISSDYSQPASDYHSVGSEYSPPLPDYSPHLPDYSPHLSDTFPPDKVIPLSPGTNAVKLFSFKSGLYYKHIF